MPRRRSVVSSTALFDQAVQTEESMSETSVPQENGIVRESEERQEQTAVGEELPPIGLAIAAIVNAIVERETDEGTQPESEMNEDDMKSWMSTAHMAATLILQSEQAEGPRPPLLTAVAAIIQALSPLADTPDKEPLPPVGLVAAHICQMLQEDLSKGITRPSTLANAALGAYMLIDPKKAEEVIKPPAKKTTSKKRKFDSGVKAPLQSPETNLAVFYICKYCKPGVTVRPVETCQNVDHDISFTLCNWCVETNRRLQNGF